MNFYVYVYLDPRKPGKFQFENYYFEYEPIYIGKGCRNRIRHHLVQRLKKKSFFYNKLNKIIDSGYEPIFYKLIDNLSEETALLKEIEWINLIGRIDIETGTLCNLSEGGERGFHRSEETREKIRQSKLGNKNPMFGKTTSDKQKEAVKQAHKDGRVKLTDEGRKKLIEKNKLRKGKKNINVRSNIKTFKLVNPQNEEFIILGVRKLQKFCSENNIKFQLLRKKIGNTISELDITHKNKIALNTINWSIYDTTKTENVFFSSL